MALDKNDLQDIGKIVFASEVRLNKRIGDVELKLGKKIIETENKVIAVISREVADLSEINRAVIKEVDKIADLEKRIIRI